MKHKTNHNFLEKVQLLIQQSQNLTKTILHRHQNRTSYGLKHGKPVRTPYHDRMTSVMDVFTNMLTMECLFRADIADATIMMNMC